MRNLKRAIRILVAVICLLSVLTLPAAAVPISLRVGVNINTPPLQYLDEEGAPQGLYIDILNAVAEDRSFQIEYLCYENTDAAMSALEAREIDAVLGVVTSKYVKYPALFTDEIYSTSLCLVTDDADKDGYRSGHIKPFIVLESDTINHSHLNNQISSCTVLKDNQISAFRYFREGKADVFAGIKESAVYLMEEEGSEALSITTNYIATVSHSIAVHQEDNYLCQTINRSLAELHTSGSYERIVERWVVPTPSGIPKEVLRKIMIAGGLVLLFFTIYLVDSLRVKRLLRTEVSLRTADLNHSNERLIDVNHQLERKLSENEEYARLLDEIVEASSSAMMLLDEEYHVVHCNQYASNMLKQISGERSLSENAREILLKADRQLSGGASEEVSGGRVMIDYADGSTHTMRYSIHLLPRDDTIPHYLVSVEDVTAEIVEQAAEYERQKNQALNNMITGLAHEIKNPLTSISAAIGMVKSKRYDDDFIAAFHEVVPQEVNRINRLVQNLVSYAKPSRLDVERVDLTKLLLDMRPAVEPYVTQHGAILDFDVQEGLTVRAAKDRMNQILLNLLMNSVDSFKERGAKSDDYQPLIRLSAGSAGSIVSVSVWDNGSGMDEEQIKMCTQPFYTTKLAGTGLGLAVSSQYISEIGGTIHIASEPGVYTKVTVFIPNDGCSSDRGGTERS